MKAAVKLLVLSGLPASGKSTYAKSLVLKGWVRTNKDELRQTMNGGKWSKQNELLVTSYHNKIVHAALTAGRNVVVDNTNLNPSHTMDLQAIAQDTGSDFLQKYFEVSVDEAIKRDLDRPGSVGSKVIRQMDAQYIHPPKPAPIYNDDLPDAIIVDIDGTLAHGTGRSPYDYSLVHTDRLDHTVSAMVSLYRHSQTCRIIIVSGRDDDCKNETRQWLRDKRVRYDALYMRLTGDKRDDRIVKQEIYEANIKGRLNVLFVLDDRDRVVRMWREQGLKCLQVADGDF